MLNFPLALAALAALGTALPVEKKEVSIPDYIKEFKGFSYTPFDQNKDCRTEDEIKTDLDVIKDFDLLHLYSSDCNVVQYAAETISGKLIVTVNDVSSSDEIASDITTIQDQVIAGGSTLNDKVDTIIIGNELIYNGWYTADEVTNFITEAKAAFPNFNGSWITSETVSSFYGNPDLCGAVDYVGINNHPYFDGQTPETAGSYVLGHIQALAEFCEENGHSKEVKVLETGWPWAGNADGVAVPSSENQVTALKNIASAAGSDCIVFSAYNELWKTTSDWDVERSWGVLGNAPSVW
ncbi:hypothetical protein DASC09_053310 [Saccharomycopsis crataegensis]|uniref:glucan endo-1,3-beta-D-glucosidase n=1 Tax=Saccharomycopsis crataegensis TaxID=43959 RepID=A0AAV5QTH2_9ASCO|nr:hypothetical protein DASC09_053310 [Saccharomycopsis crataegensis]